MRWWCGWICLRRLEATIWVKGTGLREAPSATRFCNSQSRQCANYMMQKSLACAGRTGAETAVTHLNRGLRDTEFKARNTTQPSTQKRVNRKICTTNGQQAREANELRKDSDKLTAEGEITLRERVASKKEPRKSLSRQSSVSEI